MAVADPNHCLFCGVELTAATRTQEHVFPRWLQERCAIANSRLDLANATAVRYSQLVVPACEACNGIEASQLERRVASDAATAQDTWLWMLKIQLGIRYWESGKPFSRDRRSDEHDQAIVSIDTIDLDYFRTIFSALKGTGATFDPEPSGSLWSFPDPHGDFDYADRIFVHPRAPEERYCAGMIAFDGRLWIALFDDGRRVADSFIDDPRCSVKSPKGAIRERSSLNSCTRERGSAGIQSSWSAPVATGTPATLSPCRRWASPRSSTLTWQTLPPSTRLRRTTMSWLESAPRRLRRAGGAAAVEVGGHRVRGMAVEVVAGPVIRPRRPWVRVPHRILDVLERDAGAEQLGREAVAQGCAG